MSYSQNQFQEDHCPASPLHDSMTPGGGFYPFAPSQDQDYPDTIPNI